MSDHPLLTIREQCSENIANVTTSLTSSVQHFFFKNRRGEPVQCMCIQKKEDGTHHIDLSYYIGLDWIVEKEQALYVHPKLNEDSEYETNYVEMLFSALKHPEVSDHTSNLYKIKWDDTPIYITHQQDMLTPLLVAEFLSVVKRIVRKGLKNSYYKVEQNLNGRVKGKVLVGDTIRQNLVKNKPLNTWCSYHEFGLNGLENRLLKKALVFVQRYMPRHPHLKAEEYMQQAYSYIMPAFANVSEDVNINDIVHTKTNAFYKEYTDGLRLARLILKRFGYNITNTTEDKIPTPPFWIDMSKLFELYVLGLLKDRFVGQVDYQYKKYWNELDYLLNAKEGSKEYKMVIDAKYKIVYQNEGSKDWDIDNIRQISGYARLKPVYDDLKIKDYTKVIDCLIIYPENLKQDSTIEKEVERFRTVDFTDKGNELHPFVSFFKVPVYLPVIRKK